MERHVPYRTGQSKLRRERCVSSERRTQIKGKFFGVTAAMMFSCYTLTGCAGGSSNSSATGPIQSSTMLPNGLTLTLAEDKASVPVGGQVVYTETLRNATAALIQATIIGAGTAAPHALDMYELLSVSGATVGLIAYDGGSFMALPVAPPPITTVTLQPGQSISGTTTYRLTRADRYTAQAYVVSEGSTGFQGTPYDAVTVQSY